MDKPEHNYVSRVEFSDFKDSDAQWKKGIDSKIDALVNGFADYKTRQSEGQSWRSMLPLIGLLIVVGSLVVIPIYDKLHTGASRDDRREQRLLQAIDNLAEKESIHYEELNNNIGHAKEIDLLRDTHLRELFNLKCGVVP